MSQPPGSVENKEKAPYPKDPKQEKEDDEEVTGDVVGDIAGSTVDPPNPEEDPNNPEVEDGDDVESESDELQNVMNCETVKKSEQKDSDRDPIIIESSDSDAFQSAKSKCESDVPEPQSEAEVLQTQHRSFPPIATTPEETWDFTLRPQTEIDPADKNKKCGTIWLGDHEFQAKLEGYNVFNTCDHEVIKIECPCENKVAFAICSKCHRVFCNNKCLKKTKEKKVTTNGGEQQECSLTPGPSSGVAATSSSSPQSDTSRNKTDLRYQLPAKRSASQRNSQQHNQIQGGGRIKYNADIMIPSQVQLQYPRLFPTVPVPAHWINQNVMPPLNVAGGGGIMGPCPADNQYSFPQQQQLGVGSMPQHLIPISSFRLNTPPQITHRVNRDPGLPTTLAPVSQPVAQYNSNNIGSLTPRPGPMVAYSIRGARPQFNPAADGQSTRSWRSGDERNGNAIQQIPDHRQTISNRDRSNSETDGLRYQGTRTNSTSVSLSDSVVQIGKTDIADVSQLQKFRGVGRGAQPNITDRNSPTTSQNVGNSSNSSANSSVFNSSTTPRPVPQMSSDALFSPRQKFNPYAPVDVSRSKTRTSSLEQPDPKPHNHVFSKLDNTVENTHREPISGLPANKWSKYPPGQNRSTFTDRPTGSSKFMTERNTTAASISSQPGTTSPTKKLSSPASSSSHTSPFKTKPQMETGLQNFRKLSNPNPQASKEPILCDPYIFYGVPMQVVHMYGDSLFDFHVATSIGCNANDAIIEELLTVGDVDPKKRLSEMSLTVGEYCIAKYTSIEDGTDDWYRARVTQVLDNLVHVYFFDYGNTAEVTKALIRPLPASLRQIRPSAIRIAMGDFEPSVAIDQFQTVFENFILERKLRVTIFENPTTSNTVSFSNYPPRYQAKLEIMHNDQWVQMSAILENDELGRRISFGTRVFKQLDTKCDDYPVFSVNHIQKETVVKISHFNHPNEFYVIPEDCIEIRESVMKKLNAINAKYGPYSMKEWIDTNYVCVVKRPDGRWARAKLTEITESSTARIRFCDFGESLEVPLNDLKAVPKDLLSIPQLAYRCSLPIFPSQGKWDLADPDITILQEMKEANVSIVIVVFALEFDIPAHIIEVFRGNDVGGLSKALLKAKKTSCVLDYDVDLDIRLNRKKPQPRFGEEDPSTICQKPSSSSAVATKIDKIVLTSDTKSLGINEDGARYWPNSQASGKGEIETQFFQLKDLEPSKSLKLFSTSEFKIIHVKGFNELFIQPSEFVDLKMRLQDQIIECIDSGSSFNGTPPPLNSIVIASCNDGNFHRALITKISGSRARVEFIDIGISSKVPLERLTPASACVLQFPKLVYHVKLKDIEDKPKLLLYSDFIELVEKLTKMTHLMEMCNGSQEPYIVSLRPLGAPKADTVSKRILNKQIWEWESLVDSGFKTDIALLSKGKFRDEYPTKSHLIQYRTLPSGVKFTGEVSQFLSEGDICIVDIQESQIKRDHVVLENQISRYVQKVSSTKFYPILEEVMLIYLPDIPLIQDMNVRGIGKWNRCVREDSDRFRNIDYDELYPVGAKASTHFEFRRLPPEFLHRVNAGMVLCTLKDYKPSESLHQRMLAEFGGRKQIRFTVDCYDEEDVIHTITVEGLPM